MKKIISLMLMVTILFCVAATQDSLPLAMKSARAESAVATQAPAEEYDFKQFRWGASKEEVIAVEGTPLTEAKVNGYDDMQTIAYFTTIVDLDALLAYTFCNEGLCTTTYFLAESHSNNSLYIDDYEKIKSVLEKKYGKPLIDSENWENDSKEKSYADKKGDALYYGYLNYSTYWVLDRTIIYMSMSKDNNSIKTSVSKLSTELSPIKADFSDEI